MSYFPDTPRPMQLCAAMLCGMPVYEATGIETKKAELRERMTQCLCALTNTLYMGGYSIGAEFRISYVALLNANGYLLTEEYKAMQYGQREIKFKWMLT